MIDLSIVIITYNRSPYLRRTLTTLADSAFCDCELWILNNASTDDTLSVCAEFESRLPDMRIVTHRFNIGASANVLRAYEYGSCYYKWILCDDDILLLDQANDLLEIIRNREADLMRLSEIGVVAEERGKVSTLESLLHDPNSFSFFSFGFIPSIIFRQSAIESFVHHGYENTASAYPQAFVLLRAFGLNARVYTTANSVVKRGDAPMTMGSEIVIAQIRSLAALPTQQARKAAMGWRRKHQKWVGYFFGYGRLIARDLQNGRPRRQILSIWAKTVSAAPSLGARLTLFMNGLFILTPQRLVYYLSGAREMKSTRH